MTRRVFYSRISCAQLLIVYYTVTQVARSESDLWRCVLPFTCMVNKRCSEERNFHPLWRVNKVHDCHKDGGTRTQLFWEWHIFVFKFIINAYFETYMRSPEDSARWNIVSRLAEICIISNLPNAVLVLLTVPPVSTASAKYTAASVALNVWRSIYVLRSMYWTLEWLGSATYSSQWIDWLDVVLTPSTPAVSNCCC